MTPLRRLLILAVGVLLLGGVGAWSVLSAADRAEEENKPRPGGPAFTAGRVTLDEPGRLVFRNTAAGPQRDHLVSVPADRAAGSVRTASDLSCLRFHSAAGTGVCLQSTTALGRPAYRAQILDAGLRTVKSYPLAGIPSRARVSPSGKLAAWTVFVKGESYGTAFFSTRTSILDTRGWQLIPNLEEFAITLEGRPYRNQDVNFWGVTFATDDDTFYATLSTGDDTYLVRGSVRARAVTTLTRNVECPSLSPDGTRVAYKKRVLGTAALWREHVLDLRTLKSTTLAERRSVDDQAVWLDAHTLAYALPADTRPNSNDTWTVPADGTGTPKLLFEDGQAPPTPVK
ncbi:TolB-like translocation protein [Streptomyces sp. SKN60]|uniref:TolB-like translocation protein n=1 Tax=Streptomyces sp. SKN60 TaxID=2855506 RepID=UPI00224775DC|nr:TolB-like translocation protein [Streptomyces sp. SKN60]MCX2183860.1 TolB-like translocation protein [Streptomyces sp. SKN60]